MSINTNQDAALRYAEQGMRVFPVHSFDSGRCSCGKPNCKRPGKHPQTTHGVKDATAYPDHIKRRWNWNIANIGVASGWDSNLIVLDIDGSDGEQSLNKLERIYGRLPVTRTVKTGQGRHYYFRYPDNLRVALYGKIKNSKGKLGKGLDVRADGGYVIAPPSVHASGRRYEWIDENVEIVPAPGWLLSKLTEEDVAFTESPTEEQIQEGERNPALYKAVCGFFRSGMTQADALASALLLNERQCNPPKSEAEVRDIVARVGATHRPAARPKRRNQSKLLNWFQFDVAKFQSNPRLLTMGDCQLGWWLRLLALAWMNEGTLPLDPNKLFKMAGASSKEKFMAEWRDVLFDFEEVERDGQPCLVHRDFEQLYAEKLERVDQTKAAAQAGAAKREEERQKLEKELRELRQGKAKVA